MKNKFFSNAPIHIMLILEWAIAMALPFIWMILTSGKRWLNLPKFHLQFS